MKKLLLLTFLALTCLLTVNAQGNTPQSRINRAVRALKKSNKVLTLDMLKKADKIVYFTDNGSVAPDYQYDCYVTVTPKSISVEVTAPNRPDLFDFSDSAPITAAQYDLFIKSLAAQKMYIGPEDEVFPCGASARDITVEAAGKVLFKGIEYDGLHVTKGSIDTSFKKILPSHLRTVLADPFSALPPVEDIDPINEGF